jgi:hypothetical protein
MPAGTRMRSDGFLGMCDGAVTSVAPMPRLFDFSEKEIERPDVLPQLADDAFNADYSVDRSTRN